MQRLNINTQCVSNAQGAALTFPASASVVLTIQGVSSCWPMSLHHTMAPADYCPNMEVLRGCVLVRDNMATNNTCEFNCACVSNGGSVCALYITQSSYIQGVNSNMKICDLHIQDIN